MVTTVRLDDLRGLFQPLGFQSDSFLRQHIETHQIFMMKPSVKSQRRTATVYVQGQKHIESRLLGNIS